MVEFRESKQYNNRKRFSCISAKPLLIIFFICEIFNLSIKIAVGNYRIIIFVNE